jgi:GntR family transcriptional regulator
MRTRPKITQHPEPAQPAATVLQVDPGRFRVDPGLPTPLYYQIRENLRELIRSEDLPEGALIPSERELSDIYGVNRLTVRQAITELVNEGLLDRRRGIGTFVANHKIAHPMPDLAGFSERMLRTGHKPGGKVLSLTTQHPARSVAQALKIPLDGYVVSVVRLRLVDDEPIMLETCALPADLVPGLRAEDLDDQSLYRVLATRYGIQMVEAEEVLEPVSLTSYEAQILDTETGRPALLVEGIVFTNERKPVEFTKSLVRGDKARFYFRLHRTGDADPMG